MNLCYDMVLRAWTIRAARQAQALALSAAPGAIPQLFGPPLAFGLWTLMQWTERRIAPRETCRWAAAGGADAAQGHPWRAQEGQ